MGYLDRSLPYPEPELVDGTVRLRPWQRSDVDCVRLASTDERIPEGTTVPAVYSPAEGVAFIERQWGRQTAGEGLSLAIEDTSKDRAVGLVVAMFRPPPGVVSLGYWIVPPERGLGHAGRAVALFTRWLLDHTPTTRVEAIVEPDNVPSRRTLRRCGFQEEGCLRSYLNGQRDVIIYSLLPADLLPC